jgi:hypothetical protein
VELGNASFNAVLGNSAGFDGSSARVAVPDLGSSSLLTIEAWIKPEIYKTSQAVYTADDIAAGAPTFELIDEGGITFSLEGNDPTDLSIPDDGLFPAAEWRYVVLTYDAAASTAKAYVNGELVAQMPYNAAGTAALTPAHLGAGSDVNSYYRGLIDEFAVYTNVLSLDRILAHYATVTGPVLSPEPQDAAIFSGNTVTFTAGLITGFDEVPQIQWQRNGTDIPGAVTGSYTTPALTDADSGARYRAVITAGGKTYTTREAAVSVTSLPATGYRDAVLADNPVAYYRFEDAPDSQYAADSSAAQNNTGEYDGVILEQPSFSAVLGMPPGLTIRAWRCRPSAATTRSLWKPGSSRTFSTSSMPSSRPTSGRLAPSTFN